MESSFFLAQTFGTEVARFVMLQGIRGEICGGFSDSPWSKPTKAQYVSSEKAFLFTLANNEDVPPMKFDIAKKSFATCHHPE